MADYFDMGDNDSYETICDSIMIPITLPNNELKPDYKIFIKDQHTDTKTTVGGEKARILQAEGIDHPLDDLAMVVILDGENKAETEMDDNRTIESYLEDLSGGQVIIRLRN